MNAEIKMRPGGDFDVAEDMPGGVIYRDSDPYGVPTGVVPRSVEGKRDWLQTFTGRAFDLSNPQPRDIVIRDIAHALSNLCRFAGHCDRFYSVAEHSVHVSRVVPPADAFAGLMHDASEAYVIDLPRPLKQMLPSYSAIESRVWDAIAARFDIGALPPSIKAADNYVLLAERDQLLQEPPIPWYWAEGLRPANIKVQCLPPEQARDLFMGRFIELWMERNP